MGTETNELLCFSRVAMLDIWTGSPADNLLGETFNGRP
jgi:hypothetical protein